MAHNLPESFENKICNAALHTYTSTGLNPIIYQLLNYYFIGIKTSPIYSGGVEIKNWNYLNEDLYRNLRELTAFLICYYTHDNNSRSFRCISGQKGRRFLILQKKNDKKLFSSGFLSATSNIEVVDRYNEGAVLNIEVPINSIPVIYSDELEQFIFPPGAEFEILNYNEERKIYYIKFKKWHKDYILILLRSIVYFINTFYNRILEFQDMRIPDEIAKILKINLTSLNHDDEIDDDYSNFLLDIKQKYLYHAISRKYEIVREGRSINDDPREFSQEYGREEEIDDYIKEQLENISDYDYNDMYDYSPEEYIDFYEQLYKKL